MKDNARALLSLLLVVLATMFLAGCGGSYNCQVTFGSSTCTPSGSGFGGGGGGGGGGGTSTAFAFAVDQGGTIDGYTLNSSGGTFAPITNFVAPSTAIANNPGAGMVIAQQTGQQPFVYALFGQPNNELFGWSMSTSGVLTPVITPPAALALNLDPSIPFNQYSMTTNPQGTLLFIADSFDYEILVFQISNPGA